MKYLFALLLSLASFVSVVQAQTEVYIRGSGKLFPIALPQLCAQQGESGAVRDIPRVIARDLDLSGYFQVLNPEAYIESPGKCGSQESFAYSDWTVIGAEGLVRGVVYANGPQVKVQLYLHDVTRQKVVLGKEYEGDLSQVPLMAHKFANEIMKFFTGEMGIFGTQIAFSGKVGRFKELFIMDMDGSNIRQLTNDHSLSLSPGWHPSGKALVYTSYRSRSPDLFTFDIPSRRVTQLTRDPSMELGAKFAADGATIIGSVTAGRGSNLVLWDAAGRVARRLTAPSGSIDVSPDYSPNGSQIAFCSDRAGGPQIYVMNADGTNAHRISFGASNYCTSPDWSPKGDRIAFVCRADSGFQIFVANPDGSNALQLTSSGDNEDPDFSPDGRYLAFSSTFSKKGVPSLALMRADGSNIRQLTQSRNGDGEPAWGPVIQ